MASETVTLAFGFIGGPDGRSPAQHVDVLRAHCEQLHALILGASEVLKQTASAESWPAQSLLEMAAAKADEQCGAINRLSLAIVTHDLTSGEAEATHG